MSKAFKSFRGDFNRKNDAFRDFVMGHMALDIERLIKTSVGTPVKTGDMKAETRSFKHQRTGSFRVESPKEYAAVQEAGERQGVPFTNYTTSGTSGGWFHRAIAIVASNRANYVKEGVRAVFR